MFAMVSSNLADLMSAVRPKTAHQLVESLREGSEVSDAKLLESANSAEQRREDQEEC